VVLSCRRQLAACSCQITDLGYVLIWRTSDSNTDTVQWITCTELPELAKDTDSGLPHPIWLLPTETVQKYHPLEVSYLWVMRSLFDLLAFVSWEGGLDVTTFGQEVDSHPAIALITNRFLLYHEVAGNLPVEVRDQLPFYADQEYDLGIEVLEYLDPPMVRYAILPGREPGHVSIVQSIMREADESKLLFREDENGNWYFLVAMRFEKCQL